MALERVAVLFVGSTETRGQFVHSAQQTSPRTGVAGLGFQLGEAEERPELHLDEPDLRRGRQPAAEEVARAGKVTEALRCKAEVAERPRAPVEVAARLADCQALFEELGGALVVALTQ